MIALAYAQDRLAEFVGQPSDVMGGCIVLTLALFAASIILTQLLTPRPKFENARPAGLGDFNVPTATEARIQPIIFGKVRQRGPNVVWYGSLQQIPIRKSVKVNLFHSTNITTGFRYFLGMQFGLCRGDEFCTLRKVWIGDDLIWEGNQSDGFIFIDKPDLFGGDEIGQGGVRGRLSIYRGDQTDAGVYLSARCQASDNTTPSYAGLMFCVFEGGYIGNSTSIKPWSFEIERNPNPLDLDEAEHFVNGHDCNLANVAHEFITNTEWGLGQPAADIDTDNLTTAAETLTAEGNGMSMIVDNALESQVFLEEIERQINGKVFLDQRTGLWTTKLVRDDYSLAVIPHITAETNIKSVDGFTRGAWLDTSNQVRLYFFDRAMDYAERPAFASDQANAMLQGGGTVLTMRNVCTEVRFCGIKDATLAAQTAWRVLRTVSYPLAKASFVVDRSLWALKPFDVVAWSDPVLGFSRLPMRITSIDYGNIEDGSIKIDTVQDVFKFAAASFAANQGTGWHPPGADVDPFDDVLVIEAPRAMLTRDPLFAGTYRDKVLTVAAVQAGETGYETWARVSPDAYSSNGTVLGSARIGTLVAALSRGDVNGITFSIECGTDAARQAILNGFDATASVTDLGVGLTNMVRIESEFLLVGAMAEGTGNEIDCSNVYRQVMDTTQSDHALGTEVWCDFVGGTGLTNGSFVAGASVNVKLAPFDRYEQLDIAGLGGSTVSMDDRLRRPMPPGRIALNGVDADKTLVSLEGTGSGDTTGILLGMIRRDFRSGDEVRALTIDAGTLFPDFPAANTTTYTVSVYNTTGSPTLLFTTAPSASAAQTINRTTLWTHTDCVVPSSLQIRILASHIYEGTTYPARVPLVWDFTTVSTASGVFSFGSRTGGVPSTTYTAASTGTFTLSIATPMPSGLVQIRINGGSLVTVIATGLLAGTFLATSGDAIVVQHSESLAGFQTLLLLRDPSSVAVAYGVCFNS